MDVKLKDTYRLRVSDFNCYDILTPHAILDLFQDIAGKHATNYNMSYDDLIANNMIWVLAKVKYKVISQCQLYSNVNVITWPKNKGLVDFDRSTQIYDLDGNLLVAGISKWIIINSETRKIIPAKHINYTTLTSDEKSFEDDNFEKLKDFDIVDAMHFKYQIEYVDLDHNGHVNNIRYCYMISNALRLKENELIDSFQIDFLNETHDNDVLDIYYKKNSNYYDVKALNKDNLVFIAKVELQ